MKKGPHHSIAVSVIDRSQIWQLGAFRDSLILIMLISASRNHDTISTANNETTSMKIWMDKILEEIVEQAYEEARLGRDREFVDRNEVFAETLADLESDGDAMRYLDSKGRIRWKATPDLRDYLNDLKLDAEADLEDEWV